MKRALSHKEHLERLDSAITLENLTVTNGGFTALHDVSINIPAGEITAIIGPNNAGKTTLLKTALGIIKPTTGTVYVFARNDRGLKNDMGFIPYHNQIDWSFPTNVFDFALTGSYDRLKHAERPQITDKEVTAETLERFALYEIRKKNIGELTFGERQRLLVARCVIQDPRIYFADEPTTACDKKSTEIIIKIFHELKNLKRTIITAHHHVLSVPAYFDNVAFLNININAFGKVADVFTESNIRKTFVISDNLTIKSLNGKS